MLKNAFNKIIKLGEYHLKLSFNFLNFWYYCNISISVFYKI